MAATISFRPPSEDGEISSNTFFSSFGFLGRSSSLSSRSTASLRAARCFSSSCASCFISASSASSTIWRAPARSFSICLYSRCFATISSSSACCLARFNYTLTCIRCGAEPPVTLPGCRGVYYDACTMMSEAARPTVQVPEEPQNASEREPGAGSDPGFLWDFWYPALRSSQVRGNRLAAAMLLEVPLVIGRTKDGRAFAMRDSCPHRGMPLSYGHFDGKNLECSYHGWRFDACSGRCFEIPSLTSQDKLKVDRIFAGHY